MLYRLIESGEYGYYGRIIDATELQSVIWFNKCLFEPVPDPSVFDMSVQHFLNGVEIKSKSFMFYEHENKELVDAKRYNVPGEKLPVKIYDVHDKQMNKNIGYGYCIVITRKSKQ
jgi:hypothetical protein